MHNSLQPKITELLTTIIKIRKRMDKVKTMRISNKRVRSPKKNETNCIMMNGEILNILI